MKSSSALFLITPTLEGRIGLKLPYDLIPLPAEVAERLQQQRPRGKGCRFEVGTDGLTRFGVPVCEMKLQPSFLRCGPGEVMTWEILALASMH